MHSFVVSRGHADFYPNRGTNPQPGCATLDVVTLAACSHFRAPLFFAESIMLPESFPVFKCESVFDVLPTAASCFFRAKKNPVKSEIFMGEYVNQSYVNFYYELFH